jgi:hypothetical protein
MDEIEGGPDYRMDLSHVTPSPEAVAQVPEELARRLEIVPLAFHDGGKLPILTVGVAYFNCDPVNLKSDLSWEATLDALGLLLRCSVTGKLADEKQVLGLINEAYQHPSKIITPEEMDKMCKEARDLPRPSVEEKP